MGGSLQPAALEAQGWSVEEGYAEPPLPVNAGWERRDRLAEPSIPGLWQWALDHTDAEPGGGPQPSNLVPALLSRGGGLWTISCGSLPASSGVLCSAFPPVPSWPGSSGVLGIFKSLA